MSLPPVNFKPLGKRPASFVSGSQATHFRTLSGNRRETVSRYHGDDFRPLGGREIDDEDQKISSLSEDENGDPLAEAYLALSTEDHGSTPDEEYEDPTGAVREYGLGDVSVDQTVSDTEPAPLDEAGQTGITGAIEPDLSPLPDQAAAPQLDDTPVGVDDPGFSPMPDMASAQEQTLVDNAAEQVAITNLLEKIVMLETTLVERVTNEVCAAISDALRDFVGQKYLDRALPTFADELMSIMQAQSNGNLTVSGPANLIDQLTSLLDDRSKDLINFQSAENEVELTARLDDQQMTTRAQDIVGAFERAFAA